MERILHYEASRYADNYGDKKRHAPKGFAKYYSSLIPVYTLCIIDFIAFQKDDSYFHKFELYDRKNDIFYLGEKNEQLLQIAILELAKVGKTSDNVVRNWASLFRFNQVDEAAPDYLKKIVTETEVLSLKKEEIAMISERERNKLHSQLYLEESFLEGERRGKAEGIEQGIEQGRLTERIHLARKLFQQGVDLLLVQSVTGLDEVQLQEIQGVSSQDNK
ncbi:Rpn family recombination-promoting nuclease/putative transposase [Enterococcus sp. MMGLQ5-2]|nr:Rpn family recombination-promoting nuclease/putative transposase [Enterococcus sp. MMGLQ5-2]MBS7585110.1 Rpn family recombination-promoting nuclease/putative transposase [Enterococcus sp. MMGLQ5-1]NPD12966.1 Rpn family recombination-promoting nuclease/putative transposase [Enterococcus sp. MMGLQ5-1]NPD37680.1 Rpn family recombination-promoting nuclease/putative transposase [Enterococcus sp. MMGLQ5-2]